MAKVQFMDPMYGKQLPRAARGAFIADTDIASLYKWCEAVTPRSLLFKVWFDVTYYFMLTESDLASMLELRRDSFTFRIDRSRRRYAVLKNQQMFNSLADLGGAGSSGMELRMYEIHNSKRCPLSSLVAYLRRTNPALVQLWQRPRDAYRMSEPGVWYDKVPLGQTRLSRMMAQLSRMAGLSVCYHTGHVHNTALRQLEMAGVAPVLLRELSGRRSRLAARQELEPARSDGAQGEPSTTSAPQQGARKRTASEL